MIHLLCNNIPETTSQMDSLAEETMKKKAAEAYQLELMNEISVLVGESNEKHFSAAFNMR